MHPLYSGPTIITWGGGRRLLRFGGGISELILLRLGAAKFPVRLYRLRVYSLEYLGLRVWALGMKTGSQQQT